VNLRRPPRDDELVRAAADLIRRLRRWSPASWSVQTDRFAPATTRADATHRAVQRLADLAATAERRPTRPVPRLDDRVLPDQLAVMAHDIHRVGDPAAARAGHAELTTLRATLGFR
jgi:hypothetical protein